MQWMKAFHDQQSKIISTDDDDRKAIIREPKSLKEAGNLINAHVRHHDLRRHAATYAFRSGTPLEILSKVLLRHSNFSTTQRYLVRRRRNHAVDRQSARIIEPKTELGCCSRPAISMSLYQNE
jgi:integrase